MKTHVHLTLLFWGMSFLCLSMLLSAIIACGESRAVKPSWRPQRRLGGRLPEQVRRIIGGSAVVHPERNQQP